MRPRSLPTPLNESASAPVLEQVDYRVRLIDLLAEVRVVQVYRNSGETNIEAVFTFPMPVDATLLALEVEIADRQLTGVVVERTAGQERYEDAVVDADSAILLEEVQPGLFTLNAGNLLSGETARISLRYAQVFGWQGNSFRFFLPTVVAPRYGDPGAGCLEPHQVPPVDLLTENTCRIEVEASGGLTRAEFVSPSHRIELERADDVTRIRLAGERTPMDRDFVLNVSAPEGERTFAVREENEEGAVLWASFHPTWDQVEDPAPRSLKIVVDCSGSMAGDSIEQARRALEQILGELRPQDYFNLVRFGDAARALFRRQVKASRRNVLAARRMLAEMDADMGGTELGRGLESAYGSRRPEGPGSDLLLITDGEVWDVEPILQTAASSQHRIFTVGVGSAVSEAFVLSLASRTGGACELVTPGEHMAERIVRHFRRIGSPRSQEPRIRWPASNVEQIPDRIDSVYCDETLHAFARCDRSTGEEVALDLRGADRASLSFRAPVHPVPWAAESPALLARLAVARQLREGDMDPGEATRLAVQYQLVTPHTCVLVVAPRGEGEKAQDLPELRRVSHMLAAGWGGSGTVQQGALAEAPMEPGASVSFRAKSGALLRQPLELFRELVPDTRAGASEPGDPGDRDFIESLCSRLARRGRLVELAELGDLGLEDEYLELLWSLVDEAHGEEDLVAVFLFLLTKGLPRGSVGRQQARQLRQDYRRVLGQGGWEDAVAALESRVEEVIASA